MFSLKAESVKHLFKEATDEEKLDLISSLVNDMDYELFLNSIIVANKYKDRVCGWIDRFSKIFEEKMRASENCKEDAIEEQYLSGKYLKYLFRKSDEHSLIAEFAVNKDFFKDFLRHVHPTKWKYYRMVDGDMVLIRETQAVKQYDDKPLDFQKNIIDKQFPVSKLKIFWGNGKIVSWHLF